MWHATMTTGWGHDRDDQSPHSKCAPVGQFYIVLKHELNHGSVPEIPWPELKVWEPTMIRVPYLVSSRYKLFTFTHGRFCATSISP